MSIEDVTVVPVHGSVESPFPSFAGEDLSSVLREATFLFHPILCDLLATIRELQPSSIVVVERSKQYPVRYPLDFLFRYTRAGKELEALVDHGASTTTPLEMLQDATSEELRLFDRICTALHESVPIRPWREVLQDGHQSTMVIDLVVAARDGVWLRGVLDDTWFRVLVPGTCSDQEPMYPMSVYRIEVTEKTVVLSAPEGDLSIDYLG